MNFKIDTGSEVNVLPMTYVNRLVIDKVCISPCKTVLVTFGNNIINTIDKVKLECTYNDKLEYLEFVVVDLDTYGILALQSCIKLKLINKVNVLKTNLVNSLSELYNMYADVFTGIGKLDKKYHIEIDKDITPVVNSPRRIPLTLQPTLKKTLKELEERKIIERVEYPTDWVNRLVITEKKSGELRLCLDPRELNRAIKREHFMIPTATEVIAKLAGKKIFTVIDMS